MDMQIEEYLIDDSQISIERVILDNVGHDNSHKFLPSINQKFHFKDVFIHIDFKGAPPKFDFLMKFIKFFASKIPISVKDTNQSTNS